MFRLALIYRLGGSASDTCLYTLKRSYFDGAGAWDMFFLMKLVRTCKKSDKWWSVSMYLDEAGDNL
jgi:hypothetical protein